MGGKSAENKNYKEMKDEDETKLRRELGLAAFVKRDHDKNVPEED